MSDHVQTRIIKMDPLKPESGGIKEAAGIINHGGLVVFPTETVYGIGANALDGKACAKIYAAKGRPSDNPLIAHVSSIEMAQEIGEIPAQYLGVLERIWPSPITLIVSARKNLPRELTAGLETVAIRMPAHPVALALIRESGVPIAAPSANPSKKPSATTGSQAIKYFDGKVECIIDSGAAFFGVESTIIDFRNFAVLRPGPFTVEEIEEAFGMKASVGDVAHGTATTDVVVSPGTKYEHYAPDTRIYLYEGKDSAALVSAVEGIEEIGRFCFIGSREMCAVMSAKFGCSTIDLGKSGDLYEMAKNLYNSLIALDMLEVEFAIVEGVEERGIGLAIMNRLRKACAYRTFTNEIGLSVLLHRID